MKNKQVCFLKTQNKRKNLGQSIIEVIVALALIAVVVLGLVKVTITSINNAGFARDQRAATKYAQEGIENARKSKEETPVTFWVKSVLQTTETLGKFRRETTYTPNNAQNPNSMTILVEVSWNDSKGKHQSRLKTNLAKW
jgi:Tfp pilus assembly protein PilV